MIRAAVIFMALVASVGRLLAATVLNATTVNAGQITTPATSVDYIISEDWEGTDSGWSYYLGGTTGIDPNDTTQVIEGSESLLATPALQGHNVYAYNTALFTGVSDCWSYFLYRNVQPPNNGFTREIVWMVDSGGNHCGVIYLLGTATGARLRIQVRGGSIVSLTDEMTTGSVYSIWMRVQVGTGSDGRADCWFSATTTRPPNGGSQHAYSGSGTGGTQVQRVQYGGMYNATTMTIGAFDHIRVDDSEIGSSPQ